MDGSEVSNCSINMKGIRLMFWSSMRISVGVSYSHQSATLKPHPFLHSAPHPLLTPRHTEGTALSQAG